MYLVGCRSILEVGEEVERVEWDGIQTSDGRNRAFHTTSSMSHHLLAIPATSEILAMLELVLWGHQYMKESI